MKQSEGGDMAIVGGPRIARAFGEQGLIDEYRLWVHTTILGSGTPLLGSRDRPSDLEILDVKTFKAGCVCLHLRPR